MLIEGVSPKTQLKGQGVSSDLHLVFIWQAHKDVGNFPFKICQRGQNAVRQTDVTARHINVDKDFVLLSKYFCKIIKMKNR